MTDTAGLKWAPLTGPTLLRLVATFEGGWTSATQLLGFYGSAARGEGVYLAGTSLGKLLRTIYLCDYFTLSDFRHEIYRVLERGESVHALQRAIHIGTVPVRRGRVWQSSVWFLAPLRL